MSGTFEFAGKIRVNTTMLDKIAFEEKHAKIVLEEKNMINQRNDLSPATCIIPLYF